VRRIEVLTDADNIAMVRLLHGAGFVAETKPRQHFCRGGQYVDGQSFARINTAIMPAPAAPQIPQGLPADQRVAFDLARVQLRPVEEGDLAGVSQMYLFDEDTALGTLQVPFAMVSSRQWLITPDPGKCALAAIYDGKFIGVASINQLQAARGCAHVGYLGLAIHAQYQGGGLGKRLTQKLMDIGDRWLNYRRLDLHVFEDNHRAIALYEQLGFQHEGRVVEEAFRGGGYASSLKMGRLRS
jgi:L-phenylalanine/L-methionine N-acetyltransferase